MPPLVPVIKLVHTPQNGEERNARPFPSVRSVDQSPDIDELLRRSTRMIKPGWVEESFMCGSLVGMGSSGGFFEAARVELDVVGMLGSGLEGYVEVACLRDVSDGC